MSKVIKLRKGLNIRIAGGAEKIFIKPNQAEYFAIKPTDFHGLTPKMLVKEGELVKAGTALFHDKNTPEILFTSPVSGTVKEIIRGERRQILEVIIKADIEHEYELFTHGDPKNLSKDQVIENLLKSGLWPLIIQRPYGIVANPNDTPKSIFISAFDSAPLAPDLDFTIQDDAKEFQIGINALSKLTSGKIHLNINAEFNPSKVFINTEGVQLNSIIGPHPAGNVGVQIHHIDPINKGDVVWTLNPQDVVAIGRLFSKGIYDASRIVALTGSEVKERRYYKVMIGSQVTELIKNNLEQENVRIISGNVLTGTQISEKGFLGFHDTQLTVIPEGNHYEFLGWALPGMNKFSASKTFFSSLFPKKEYKLDTNYNGAERAFVMTGQYEKVVPMDILPQHLVKAIMVEDIDKMEQLGIYEVIEEDLALCEYVCTSKIEVQKILRND